MEPEGWLPHSQVPANCPYTEPARSSRYHHILIPEDPSYYYQPIYAWSSNRRLFLRFPHHNPLYISTHPHKRYMPRPPNSNRFYYPNNIEWGVQIIKLFIMQFSSHLCYLVPLRPKYSPHTLFSNTIHLRSSLDVSDQISHPYTTDKIIVLYILSFNFFYGKLYDKNYAPNNSQHCLNSICS
jgi:hypothetical protein